MENQTEHAVGQTSSSYAASVDGTAAKTTTTKTSAAQKALGANTLGENSTSYAVVAIQGAQYKVLTGMNIVCNRLESKVGDKVSFDKVVFVAKAGENQIGKPFTGTLVEGEVLEHIRSKKIIVFKKIRRHGYQRKQGHRQQLSVVRITAI